MEGGIEKNLEKFALRLLCSSLKQTKLETAADSHGCYLFQEKPYRALLGSPDT
jgi:hypothetical protein